MKSPTAVPEILASHSLLPPGLWMKKSHPSKCDFAATTLARKCRVCGGGGNDGEPGPQWSHVFLLISPVLPPSAMRRICPGWLLGPQWWRWGQPEPNLQPGDDPAQPGELCMRKISVDRGWHNFVAVSQLCPCGTKAARDNTENRWLWLDPIKLYLWTLKLEIHIIFLCQEIYFIYLFIYYHLKT